MEELKAESNKLTLADPAGSYSIWLSYFEIYNEQVYDLLDEPRENRIRLRVVNDKNSAFVEGVKCIHVSSLYEAYLVYMYGRYNLTVSATGVNSRSSRSHSMFSVKLLSADRSLNSSFLLCDLAGIERADRTGNVGLRLREAQRINTSFLTLNRCLRTIRENQNGGHTKCVPYRESKLTRILGPALGCEDSSLAMIVTVARDEGLLDETEAVLRASSVAANIRAPPTVAPPRRGGPFASLLAKSSLDWNEVAKKKVTKTPEQIKQTQRNGNFYFSENSTLSSALSSDLCMPDVYKELQDERQKRKQVEDKLAEVEKMCMSKLEKECMCETAEKTINLLQKELQDQEEDSMASRTEILKLTKTIRIMKDENITLNDHIKHLQSINKGLNEMLDDARDDIGSFQKEGQELERQLQETQQIINLKDDKLHTLELEIFELEQNLEKNSIEIETYDKQLMAVENELTKKKKELKELAIKHEKLSESYKNSEEKLKILKETIKSEAELLPTKVAQTDKLSGDDAKQECWTDQKTPLTKFSLRKSQKKKQVVKCDSESEELSYNPASDLKPTTSRQNCSQSLTSARYTHCSCYKISTSENKENQRSLSNKSARKKLFLNSTIEPRGFMERECEVSNSSPREALKRFLRTGKEY